jgi:hypothetical protein
MSLHQIEWSPGALRPAVHEFKYKEKQIDVSLFLADASTHAVEGA